MRGSFFGPGMKVNYTLFSLELQPAAPAADDRLQTFAACVMNQPDGKDNPA